MKGKNNKNKKYINKVNSDSIKKFNTNTIDTQKLVESIYKQVTENLQKDLTNRLYNSITKELHNELINFKNFTEKLYQIPFEEYFIAGRRWDLDIDSYIDINSEWEDQLKKLINDKCSLHPSTGVDYFLFPKKISQNE